MNKIEITSRIISILITAVFFIFIIAVIQYINIEHYNSCINNSGKAVVNEYGYFENCIYE